jgi:hypothetical protein
MDFKAAAIVIVHVHRRNVIGGGRIGFHSSERRERVDRLYVQ